MDVNQIFKDLATMVHEQGEVIDSIEAHVESSHMNVGQGVQQLAKASDYQVSRPLGRYHHHHHHHLGRYHHHHHTRHRASALHAYMLRGLIYTGVDLSLNPAV